MSVGLNIAYDNCQLGFITYAHERKSLPPPTALAYSQGGGKPLFALGELTYSQSGGPLNSTQRSEVPNPKLARRLQPPRGLPGFFLHILDPRLQFTPLAQFGVSFGRISVHLCQHSLHVSTAEG